MMPTMARRSRKREGQREIRMPVRQDAPRAKRLTMCEANARANSLDP